MKPLTVEICVGTGCCLLGSQDLLDAIETLPENKRKQIDLNEASCLKGCRKGPSVRIDENVLSDMTPDKLLEILNEKLS